MEPGLLHEPLDFKGRVVYPFGFGMLSWIIDTQNSGTNFIQVGENCNGPVHGPKILIKDWASLRPIWQKPRVPFTLSYKKRCSPFFSLISETWAKLCRDLERLGNPSRQASLFLFSSSLMPLFLFLSPWSLFSLLAASPPRASRAASGGGGGRPRGGGVIVRVWWWWWLCGVVVVTRSRLSLVYLFQICSDLLSLVSCSQIRIQI